MAVHKYPYDWRTKKPTIFRATEQWFASVEGFRQTALEAIRSVQWVPATVILHDIFLWSNFKEIIYVYFIGIVTSVVVGSGRRTYDK